MAAYHNSAAESGSNLSVAGIDTGIGQSPGVSNFEAGAGKSVLDNMRGMAQSGVGLARLATLPTSVAAQITGSPDLVGKPLAETYGDLKEQQS